MKPAETLTGLPRALALPDPLASFRQLLQERSMNTKLYVLLAAGVLALAACKNDTPTAQAEAAQAADATAAAATRLARLPTLPAPPPPKAPTPLPPPRRSRCREPALP
jgi:hypothetical protein